MSKVPDVKDVFKFKQNEYINNVDPVTDYMDMTGFVIANKLGISKEEAVKKIKKYIKENVKVNNPDIEFLERDLKGDTEKRTTSLLGYIKSVKVKGDILAPSFTVYFNPNKKESLHSSFATDNVNKRSKHKYLAFDYKMNKNMQKFEEHNVIQKTLKIFNNALSGGYGSKATMLYNPSAHYTLTSITRGMAGIGNAISEMMITGNRHYKDPTTTMGHILACASKTDVDKIKKVILRYNLHVPTADEVMDDVIIPSIKRYWRSIVKEMEIYKTLKYMNGYERAAVMYVNDLHHLAKYNDKYVRDMFDKILHTDIDISSDKYEAILKDTPDWITNLLIHVRVDDLKGKKYEIDKLDKDVAIKSAKTALASMLTFEEYSDFIQAFFVTKVFPPSIAHIKEMVRESIVLSDTDSTCATYQSWAEWYAGKMVITPTTIGVTAIVMTFTTQAIDHYIKVMAGNMNIGSDKLSILKMKNEFFWDVFVSTDVAKHYFSMIKVQEGNAFDKGDLEVKGVHLIASQIYEGVRKIATDMMIDILTKIGNNEKLSINEYLQQVAGVETMIIDMIKKSSIDVFKTEKIKEEKAYKLTADKSPFFHYNLWNMIFGEKYGKAPDPTYLAIKVPVVLDTKADMKRYIESLEDKEMAKRYKIIMEENGKDVVKSYRLPLLKMKEVGIPKEIYDIIDIDRIVKDNCSILYIILNTIGYYLKPDSKVLDVLEEDNV